MRTPSDPVLDDEDELEAHRLCAVAQKLKRQHILMKCRQKIARFVGGHSLDPENQGIGFFVVCVCDECQGKPLNYKERDGKLMTFEEFYEHGTDLRAEEAPLAWKEHIHVTPETSGKETESEGQQLGDWLRQQSIETFQMATNQRVKHIWVYWPGDARWYRGKVKRFDDEKGLCEIRYDDGNWETIILAAELTIWGRSQPEPPSDTEDVSAFFARVAGAAGPGPAAEGGPRPKDFEKGFDGDLESVRLQTRVTVPMLALAGQAFIEDLTRAAWEARRPEDGDTLMPQSIVECFRRMRDDPDWRDAVSITKFAPNSSEEPRAGSWDASGEARQRGGRRDGKKHGKKRPRGSADSPSDQGGPIKLPSEEPASKRGPDDVEMEDDADVEMRDAASMDATEALDGESAQDAEFTDPGVTTDAGEAGEQPAPDAGAREGGSVARSPGEGVGGCALPNGDAAPAPPPPAATSATGGPDGADPRETQEDALGSGGAA
eukprot:CAMPEP_0177590994 /NCGR_PEP_ID=MMETSP0419_2-20121207/7736_1 /TAXON_ID=582737 /ORGANISM="Tetraselmis sp., Strain GSL018" /LENGTH=489 /DNA_ID=CAMNT_0019081657 /DNA_START=127 /DNA_END=1592 /DNA_ORIENTATION=-